MSYRFTRIWATVLVWLGIVLGAAGVLLAFLVFVTPSALASSLLAWAPDAGETVGRHRLLLGLAALLGGLALAGPLIVVGEVLNAFLDQRQFLARQHAAIRRIEERLEFWELVRTGREKSHATSLSARLKAADVRWP